MESEMENKHHEKEKLNKDIVLISNQLKIGLSALLYNALLHHVNIAVSTKLLQSNINTSSKKNNKPYKNQKKNY